MVEVYHLSLLSVALLHAMSGRNLCVHTVYTQLKDQT